jgi:hypothetical protein
LETGSASEESCIKYSPALTSGGVEKAAGANLYGMIPQHSPVVLTTRANRLGSHDEEEAMLSEPVNRLAVGGLCFGMG